MHLKPFKYLNLLYKYKLMKVVVGSTNPVKIKATKNVFKKFFKNVEVFGVNVKSKKQPIGMKETIEGAISRAEQALKFGDVGVGIEAGLVEIPYTKTGYFDIQFCAIKDKDLLTLGCGMGFEYPKVVIEEVLKGKEVGEVMEKISGIKEIGKKMGAIGFLSKGLIDRVSLTEQAVLSALLPRINKNLYF